MIGGLFLAFPAIFPASATLVEHHNEKRKHALALPAPAVDACRLPSTLGERPWVIPRSSPLRRRYGKPSRTSDGRRLGCFSVVDRGGYHHLALAEATYTLLDATRFRSRCTEPVPCWARFFGAYRRRKSPLAQMQECAAVVRPRTGFTNWVIEASQVHAVIS